MIMYRGIYLVIVCKELLAVLALFGPHGWFPFPASLAVFLQPLRVLSVINSLNTVTLAPVLEEVCRIRVRSYSEIFAGSGSESASTICGEDTE